MRFLDSPFLRCASSQGRSQEPCPAEPTTSGARYVMDTSRLYPWSSMIRSRFQLASQIVSSSTIFHENALKQNITSKYGKISKTLRLYNLYTPIYLYHDIMIWCIYIYIWYNIPRTQWTSFLGGLTFHFNPFYGSNPPTYGAFGV